ncbi:MAG: anti-sigma factor family protein [Blastocatellia bacterium]
MECRAVVSSLSDYLDGRNIWVSDDEIEQIETHLTNCPACRNLKLELSEIKNAARELPLHTPSRALWTRISKAIEAEISTKNEPIRETQDVSGWWSWLNSRKFTFSLPQLAAAGVFTALLIVAGISGIFGANSGRVDIRNAQNALLPEEAEIKEDLERRLDAINARKAQWDLQRRADFEQRMNKIDESLKRCRHELEGNPGDVAHQERVRALYDEKRKLLDTVERLKW